ncbi:hypothetical protein Dimus_029178 [Dionaea muscipula]
MVAPLAAGRGLRKVTGGVLDQDDGVISAILGGLTPGVSGSALPTSAMVSSCTLSFVCDTITVLVSGGAVKVDLQIGGSMGDGGMVREEARVAPVVREAMRSQPIDGLRQPPSSPVVLVSDLAFGMPRTRQSSGKSSPSLKPSRVRRVFISPRPPVLRRLTTEWGFKPCFRCAPSSPRVARAERHLRRSLSPDLAVFSTLEKEDLTEATVTSEEEEWGQHPHSREPDLSQIQEIDDTLATSLSPTSTGEAQLRPLTKVAGGSVATLAPIQCHASVSSTPDFLLAEESDGSGLDCFFSGKLMAIDGLEGEAKCPVSAGCPVKHEYIHGNG